MKRILTIIYRSGTLIIWGATAVGLAGIWATIFQGEPRFIFSQPLPEDGRKGFWISLLLVGVALVIQMLWYWVLAEDEKD